MVTLVFKELSFTEGKERSGDAVLSLDVATQSAKLEYSPDAGLVIRRTARRHAKSICKSGFQLTDGKRIGAGFSLVVDDEDSIDNQLLQESHHYR